MSEWLKISSKKSLEAWLVARSREEIILVAHRAAMRIAPEWFVVMERSWAQENSLSAILLLRLNLVSMVAREFSFLDARSLAAAAVTAANIYTDTGGSAAAKTNAPVADFAFAAADASALTIARASDPCTAARAVADASVAARLPVWDSTRDDVYLLIHGRDPSKQPLWPGDNPLVSEWQQSQPILRDTPGGEFWIDWYQRALDGRPQNWPLLRDVALIDDALWKEGGEGLGREINRIAERHQLLEEVRRLKAELAEAQIAQAAIPHRGHNRPPELLPDCPVEVRAAAEEIANGLDEAEEELQLASPSPSRLKQIAAKIRQAVTVITIFAAGLSDEFFRSAAKEAGATVGKWGTRSVFAYLVLNSSAVERLADALINLAKLF